jgi:hypothetical protein
LTYTFYTKLLNEKEKVNGILLYFGDLTERTHDPRTSKAVMKSFKCKGNIQKE